MVPVESYLSFGLRSAGVAATTGSSRMKTVPGTAGEPRGSRIPRPIVVVCGVEMRSGWEVRGAL
jgi:hypothetical protein